MPIRSNTLMLFRPGPPTLFRETWPEPARPLYDVYEPTVTHGKHKRAGDRKMRGVEICRTMTNRKKGARMGRCRVQLPAASITFDEAAETAPCSTASLAGRAAAG